MPDSRLEYFDGKTIRQEWLPLLRGEHGPRVVSKKPDITFQRCVRKHLDWTFENCAVEGCGFKTTSSCAIFYAASFHLLATGPLTRQTLICQSTSILKFRWVRNQLKSLKNFSPMACNIPELLEQWLRPNGDVTVWTS